LRTFTWWFGMGCLTTLSVLMIQGGAQELLYDRHATDSVSAFLTFAMTISGGGMLAGCLALILNRLR